MAEDLRTLRNYVTAKDGLEYENLPEGMVALHITHSNLRMQMVDIRLDLHLTIAEVRHKVYRHSGTKPDSMELLIMGPDESVLARLDDDRKMLGYYSVQSGMRLHVIDKDPFSLSKGGGLEDVSLIQKYEISEDDYNKREKTVRAYKKEQLAKDPNWKPKKMMNVTRPPVDPASVPGPETTEGMSVGDRCEVQPGGRRGQVAYLGEIPEIAPGYWVGVKFDEPLGKGNGTVKGKVYFSCDDKYAGFIRPHNVTVGDFPVEDPFADLDDSDDEL
uniref:CAP-Gly domain-containing protein n=1 Tax=Globisporangium ultimum (strain ATCC 200006 / CBS 805.95 / DAOM BR144) TaxID=431595 RepID=K3X7H1_GLOUD